MAALKNKTRRSEKDAWEWIENVDCNAITREHLEKSYRIHESCSEREIHRKNCKFIPNCFNQLGEKFWMKELKDDVWHEIEDPKKQIREEGSFVGLKNLGATCYVNTLVQVWFHNDEFRSALYSWVPLDEPGSAVKDLAKDKMETDDIALSCKGDSKEDKEDNIKQDRGLPCDIEETSASKPKNSAPACPPIPLCEPWANSNEPKMFCHHLQLLLAQLQYTTRRFVDPAPFVESLGLDKEQQQDAQEFSKLFMSLLEDTLSKQPSPVLRNIVQQQFGGSYIYITRCRKCGKQSQRNSTFYELDLNIHGNTSLSQCIKEFLKEEDLQGDNQYHCNYCMSKQNATRHIKLKELPPVLNLQLLRFVFDRKTGYKKKLNNQIWFPEVLDMKEYVDANMEGCVYDLMAVLIHRGLSAYSGHYVAHIKDKKSGIWYRFNDETTEKMKGNSLNLESEEDLNEVISGGNATKRPKLSKGSSSKDAYMLVYRQRGEEKQAVTQEPPPNIQLLVAEDNSKMDEWAKQVQEIRDKMALVGRERQTEVKKVLEILPVAKADNDYEWIATDWLRKWLAVEREGLIPVDNSSLLCQHGKLHPDKVLWAKRISTKAASFFHKRYGGSPRLKSNSFCLNCVKERCLSLQFESHITEDQKFFVKALKVTCERSGYWVSKKSLKKWKVLAQEIHGQPTPNRSSTPFDESSSSSRTLEETEPSDNSKQTQHNDSPGVVEMDTGGKRGLSGSDGGSAGIDDKEKLKFNEDLLCGHGCLSTSTVLRRLVTDKVWERLRFYFPEAPEFPWYHTACISCNLRDEEEAQRLGDLKKLAVHQKSILNNLYTEKERPEFDKKTSITVYALSRTFYEEWRRFLRCPPQRRSCLSSISNKILICPHDKFLYHPRCEDNDGASSALVYLWCMEWEVLSQAFGYDMEIKIVGEVLEGNCYYLTTPDCCEECNSALVAEHFAESEEYESAEIYVRKITKQPTEEEAQAVESRSPVENGGEESPRHQFVTGGTPKSSGDCLRRSSRHRKQRGEVIITVDSSETVLDVKLELMKLFSAMPLDQHLSLNGKVLENHITLGPAGVRPGSILILKIDQPKNEFPQEEFAAQASRQPEEGFKGTSLLKHPVSI